MKCYSGYQYLLIDIANQYGLDKKLFEERIQWASDNLTVLESLADQAETKPLYMKAVMALRKAQKGIPTGHLVGMDACCSGIQIMSVLTGCIAGATATGLVDPTVRADAYIYTTKVMNDVLGGGVNISRKQAKDALMTSFYGSKAKPKEIFGEDTPELNAFYQAAFTVAPGAWELLQDLLGTWKPFALKHEWKLPDGFDAKVKVMTKKEARIEVDELDHATFTYEFYENEGTKSGLSNAANVVHSVDAYILRCIQRRCNYDVCDVQFASEIIEAELIKRNLGVAVPGLDVVPMLEYYCEQYARSGVADVVILPYLTSEDMGYMTTDHLKALAGIVNHMLTYKPFEVVTVHDEFKVHANNVNHLRQQYINVLAELADSDLLSDLLSQLHGTKGTSKKLSNNLGKLIRSSEYALS